MRQINSASQELKELLPRLAEGSVLPKRHLQVNGNRFITSLSVNDDGFPVVQFDKEFGTLTSEDAANLKSVMSEVASIGESRGGATYSSVSFRLDDEENEKIEMQ